MKKVFVSTAVLTLGILLTAGSFSSSAYAKGTKKKAVKAEKTIKKATTSKETGASTKATAKPAAKSTAAKPGATQPVPKVNTAGAASASDELFKAHGTSREEIQALIQQASGANATSASPATGEQINWQVISGGGGSSSSTNFQLVSVIGQTAVGTASSTNFNLNQGFLQNFSSAGCCLTPGDYDNNGTFNIADVTAGIARIFSGGPAASCQDQADADGNNTFNIADVTYGIARIFSGGPAPICGTTGS